MKVSLKWLAEMVDLPDPTTLQARLTLAGLEVEAVERPGDALNGVVVGLVQSAKPHPNADRLSVTEISIGSSEPRQVVCGAKNFKVGDRVPLATPGTLLPDGKRIEAAEVRGVASAGMLCSAKELGLTDSADGLLILPADAPLGVPVAQALGLDDTELTLNVTPNRPDALSHLGVAREIAVLTGKPLRPPPAAPEEKEPQAATLAEIKVQDPRGCPRYGARILEGVRVGPSPAWLQARLKACGVRPINNVVDVTNYLLLELGHPLHAFDLDRLAGKRIVVRRARANETLRTLDGKDRVLHEEDLVIADRDAPQALAGVMGGEPSEVRESTTRILLEAAYFQPASVRRTARRHALHTEASHRFERGADAFAIPRALDRAAALIAELTGATVRRGRLDAFEKLPSGRVVGLRYERLRNLLGVEVPPEEARRILLGLGFVLDLDSPEQALFSVPSFRVDVSREEDLVEEVARVWGYERIPPQILPAGASVLSPEPPEVEAERRLRSALSGVGFDEVLNYSFVSAKELEVLGERSPPIALTNPLSSEQSVMRTTLLPGLLQNLSRATRHQIASVRLYELGRAYLADPEGGVDARPPAREPLRLAGVLWGRRDGRTWSSPDVAVDFFDAKGAIEAVLEVLGIHRASFEAQGHLALHPRASAALLTAEGTRVGSVGELHPRVARALDLPSGVFVFELDLAPIFAAARIRQTYETLPRHPALLRDLAVVVSVEVPHAQVRGAILEAGGEWVEDVLLFDQYTGNPLPEGKKNLAFALRYRAEDRTLTDTEVAQAHERIVRAVHDRFGAQLRAS